MIRARWSALFISAIGSVGTSCAETETLPIDGALEVPSVFNFGETGVGLSISAELFLTNTSDQPVLIEDVELAPDFSNGVRRFRVLVTPTAIAPRSTAVQRISFQALQLMEEPAISSYVLRTT